MKTLPQSAPSILWPSPPAISVRSPRWRTPDTGMVPHPGSVACPRVRCCAPPGLHPSTPRVTKALIYQWRHTCIQSYKPRSLCALGQGQRNGPCPRNSNSLWRIVSAFPHFQPSWYFTRPQTSASIPPPKLALRRSPLQLISIQADAQHPSPRPPPFFIVRSYRLGNWGSQESPNNDVKLPQPKRLPARW